jgi:CBS domain-containing protein
MNDEVIFIASNGTISQAVDLMIKRRINGLPVVDDARRVVGIITENDIIKKTDFFNTEQDPVDILQKKVTQVMTNNPITINPDSELIQAQAIFAATNIKQIPLVCNGELVGIIGRKDIIKGFLK